MIDVATGILLTVVATSTVSGVLGMGGGMILMGVLACTLPVRDAMLLHGAAQLVSNGSRAWMLRKQVRGEVLAPYLAGAVLAAAPLAWVAWVPPKAVVLLLLGALPFVAAGSLARRLALRPDAPGRAGLCGASVTALHLTAGVSGPVLDVFFLEAPMDRREVVATKAWTQALAHAGKLLYFSALPGAVEAVPGWLFLAVAPAAVAGTALGRRLLERLSDQQFRAAGRWVVRGLGGVYLARGLLLL